MCRNLKIFFSDSAWRVAAVKTNKVRKGKGFVPPDDDLDLLDGLRLRQDGLHLLEGPAGERHAVPLDHLVPWANAQIYLRLHATLCRQTAGTQIRPDLASLTVEFYQLL